MVLSVKKLSYGKDLFCVLFCWKQETGPVAFQSLVWKVADIIEVWIKTQKNARI